MKVINYFKNMFVNLFTGILGLTLLTIGFSFFMVYAIVIVCKNVITGKQPKTLVSITEELNTINAKFKV
jgi:hypothetical protein